MTSEFDPELPEDYDDEISPDVNGEEDPEDEEPDRSPRNRNQPDPRDAEIARLQAEVADLNKRLGNAVRTKGEELKKKDEEIEEWLEKVQEWHGEEVRKARAEGFQEGVQAVEGRLLPLLGTEEKATYLEGMRMKPPEVSQREPKQFDTRRRKVASDAHEPVNDVSALVRQYVAIGVPEDQIEQTSAEAVVESAKRWIANQRVPAAQPDQGPREPVGDVRVSRGTGSTPRISRSADEARLAEIKQQLSRLKGRGNLDRAASLLSEQRQIEARIRRAEQMRRRSA